MSIVSNVIKRNAKETPQKMRLSMNSLLPHVFFTMLYNVGMKVDVKLSL